MVVPETLLGLRTYSVQSKNQSSSGNQERAYVAASRRTDRSLEARIQSARMASDIHKMRTGRTLRITEQAVLNEEMYEEDDYDMRRSHQLRRIKNKNGALLADMSDPPDATLSVKVKMSSHLTISYEEWRKNEINTLFEQSFPNATAVAQLLTQQHILHNSADQPWTPEQLQSGFTPDSASECELILDEEMAAFNSPVNTSPSSSDMNWMVVDTLDVPDTTQPLILDESDYNVSTVVSSWDGFHYHISDPGMQPAQMI